MALITCNEVAFCYEGTCVVSGLDFSVGSGDYLCIVGENGSGKSTLIKGILGLKHPSDGSIDFGEGLTRQDIGYLPQQNTIQKQFPASVQEVVLLGCLAKRGLRPFYTRRDRQAAAQAMEQLGISELARTSFGELSGGQQQRVLLARALCAAPNGLKLLILDEPMNGLDPVIKQELYQLIQRLNTQQSARQGTQRGKQQGIAIIMVTHDIQSAVQYASHLLLLNRRQEFYGTAHAFQHTTLGQDLLRDSCGNHCAVCDLTVGSTVGSTVGGH